MDLSRVDVILVQSGSMLAGFELRAFVVEALVRVFEHEREILEGKAIVEDMVCAFCKARDMDDHRLEWGPEDQLTSQATGG